MIGEENRPAIVAHADFVGILLAGERGGAHAGTDFHSFYGIDAHKRGGKIAVKLAVDRRAQPGRDSFGNNFDHGPDR